MNQTASFNAARVAWPTPDGKYVVTSSNADFIPMPPWGVLRLSVREDGSFGPHDPMHWPQVYSPGKDTRFLCMMPRAPLPERSDGIMWRRFTEDDFDTQQAGIDMTFGRLRMSHRFELLKVAQEQLGALLTAYTANKEDHQLRWLFSAYQTAFQRLCFLASWRDTLRVVCEVQRLHRMSLAWLHWDAVESMAIYHQRSSVLQSNSMGAFTSDPSVAIRLDSMGVPVWLFSPVVSVATDVCIQRWVVPTSPDDVPSDHGPFAGDVVHVSVAGTSHLNYIIMRSFGYTDIEASPMPAEWEPVHGTIQSRAMGSITRNKPTPAGK